MRPDTSSLPALADWIESRDFGLHGVYGLARRDAAQIVQTLRYWRLQWHGDIQELRDWRDGKIRFQDPKPAPQSDAPNSFSEQVRLGIGEWQSQAMARTSETPARTSSIDDIAHALAIIACVEVCQYDEMQKTGSVGHRIASDLLKRVDFLLHSRTPLPSDAG